jgi:hypothetical protein
MSKAERKDARLALEATQRADAWARSPEGTPYGSRTPLLALETNAQPALDLDVIARKETQWRRI